MRDEDYAYTVHNKYCRWTRVDSLYFRKVLPLDATWCLDSNNDIIECDVLPCYLDGPGVTGRTQPVIGSTDIRKGPAKLIQYFKAYFPSNYVFAYYHYITTYLECAVTRTLLGEGYASHRVIQSVHLRLKMADKRLNPRGFVRLGVIGCNETSRFISPALDQERILKYFDWACEPTPEQIRDCTKSKCGDQGDGIFFNKGRFPAGDKKEVESVRFYIQDPTVDTNKQTLVEASELFTFFWGAQPSGDGLKYFSCESTFSGSFSPEERAALDKLERKYSITPISVPFTVNPSNSEFGYQRFEVKAGAMTLLGGGVANKVAVGKVLTFPFTLNSKYESQIYQFGIKFTYRSKIAPYNSTEIEIGCDSHGNPYHKNGEEYLEVARTRSNNSNSSYYVDEDSDCSKLASALKIDYKHTIHLRVLAENSGTITPFARDGQSGVYESEDDVGSPVFVKVYERGTWRDWGEWSSCGTGCSAMKRSRTRTCNSEEPDEYYKLFERYVELGDCPVNKKLGRTDGELCWEVDDCFSDTLDVSDGLSAFGKINGQDMDLLNPPDTISPDVCTTCVLHKDLKPKSDEERLRSLSLAGVKINHITSEPLKQDQNVPTGKTLQLTLLRQTDNQISWVLDLDAAVLPNDVIIANVSLFKSQESAIRCFIANVAPCFVNIFAQRTQPIECLMNATNSSSHQWLFAGKFFFKEDTYIYPYLEAVDWKLKMENSGRKATVTMTMPKVDGSSMGLYQPRAYLRGSDASSSGYVALSPLVDLKVDEVDDRESISARTVSYEDENIRGMTKHNLRTFGDESYPLLINVGSGESSLAHYFRIEYNNLVEPPEILAAGISIGCRNQTDSYPMNLLLLPYHESFFAPHHFQKFNFSAVLYFYHTGKYIRDIMNQYDIMAYRFHIKHLGKVYKFFEARRLQIPFPKVQPSDVKTFKEWPKSYLTYFQSLDKEYIHDVIVCAGTPVDGGWSEFRLSYISAYCGIALTNHTRKCNNPPPYNGGAQCTGKNYLEGTMDQGPCPHWGFWLEWGEWSKCDQPCGQCILTRSRECQEGKLCEVSGKLANRKKRETITTSVDISCDGDCKTDRDCRGMAAPAVCDGNPRRCRFLCQDSMHCSNGICTEVERWSGGKVSICVDQCSQDDDCSPSHTCIGRRCMKQCNFLDPSDSPCDDLELVCSEVNHHCTRPCGKAESCRRHFGPLGTCFAINKASTVSECVIGCFTDSDCISNDFTCLLGMCVYANSSSDYGAISCTEDTSCPLNSVCDLSNKVCVDPQTITCGDDQHCGQASMCVSGICKPIYNFGKSCSDHNDCGYLEICDAGKCVLQQDNNGKVVLPTVGCMGCDSRIANSVCADDKCQCAEGQRLVAGRVCVEEEPTSPSEDDIQKCVDDVCFLKCFLPSDCLFAHFCHNGFCRESCSGSVSTATESIPAPTCSNDWLACDGNLCKKTCSDAGSCLPYQKCVDGICLDGCIAERDCPRGFTCSGGVCVLSCVETGECRDGEVCSGASCHAQCTSASDCADSESCHLGLCNSACQKSADCPQSQTCVGGLCTSQCADNSSCHSNACVEGVCSSSCSDAAICGGSWVCEESTCILECTSSAQCHMSQKCGSKGMCVSVIGDSCKTDVDCNADGRFIVNRCNQTTSTCESYFRPGASCKKSSECGTFAICAGDKCTWPKDVNSNRLPPPAPVRCSGDADVCKRLVRGGMCKADGYCGCEDNHQQILGRCIPEIGSCMSLANCPSNHICQDGSCQSLCRFDSDCGSLICLHGGVCGFSCQYRSCPSGSVCISSRCEKKCEVGEVTDRACASDLQTCLDGICRPTTQLGECVEGTIPRNGVCVSKCQRDSDCQDICVVGACSSSCSSTRRCPSGYSCMSGRCFSQCDVSLENVCGVEEKYQCLIGLSTATVGTGLCVYKSEYPPISDKDFDLMNTDLACDLSSSIKLSGADCGPSGQRGTQSKGPCFFAGDTLAISCQSDDDCELESLFCMGGFCTTFCNSTNCGTAATCSDLEGRSPPACYISCDVNKCPQRTRCSSSNGQSMCLPILHTTCTSQDDCLDATGQDLYCDLVSRTCVPYEKEGQPCIYASHCGVGTFCPSSRICTRHKFISEKDKAKCSDLKISGVYYNSTSKSCGCPDNGVVFGNRCLKHAYGNGFFGRCSADVDCPATGVCIQNVCLKKCTVSCSKGFVCQQGTCQPLCKNDNECASGMSCSLGVCVPKCEDNSTTNACGSIGKCVGGACYEHPILDEKRCTDQGLVFYENENVCLYPCALDSECQHGACVTGVCSTTCSRVRSDCPSTRECISGRCQLSCHPDHDDCPNVSDDCINRLCAPACQKEIDCDGYFTCIGGHCVERCEEDYDCSHFLSDCHEGVCTQRCSAPDECPAGYNCDISLFTCIAGCTSDDQCSAYQMCDSRTKSCVTKLGETCTSHTDCGQLSLLYCSPVTSLCEAIDKEGAPCNRQNCGLNEICTRDRVCQLRVDWNGNPTSHPDTPLDVTYVFKKKDPPNEDCSLDSECRNPDDVCISYHCYSLAKDGEEFRGCELDNPLPQRLVSSDGLQLLTCVESSDCDSNQLCVDCVCAAKCRSDSDCTDFQKCFLGLCMEYCSSADQSCHSASDVCIDGLCRDQCDESATTDLMYGSCSGGVINPICHASAPCPSGYVCEKYVCERLCNDVNDCAQRQVCGLSTCTTPCSGDNANCVNGTRVNRCYSHLDCGLNRYCILGVCSPKCSCENNGNCDVSPCDTIGWLCDSQTRGCVPPVVEEKEIEEEEIGVGCVGARDCQHYNLYCNLDTKQCFPVKPVIGGSACNLQSDVSFCGVNGECVSGQCDCIRNGANQCVGSPPTPCNKQLEGDAACSHGQVCDARYDWCVCPSGSVILGERCVRTISATGGGYYFDTCAVDSQCPLSSSCISGNCYPHCINSRCVQYPGTRCHAGMCMLTCVVNSDCDVYQYCSTGGICVQRCTQGHADHCAEGQYCVSGECQLSCHFDNSCEDGSICINNFCVSICIFDFDCPEACIHGICGKSCDSQLDCPEATSCQNGRCIQKCVTSKSCPSDQICLQGYCTADCPAKEDGCRERCTDSSQCARGLQCVHGLCSAPCARTLDCGDEFICDGGVCVIACTEDEDNGDTPICPSHLYCDFQDGYCKTPTGDICDSSSDCDIGSYCSGRLCRNGVHLGSKCKTDGDCGLEELCVLGACECLRAYQGKCVEYPIPCASINSEISGQSYCDSRLQHSTCHADNNWCLCENPYQRLGDRCVSPPSEVCIDGCPYGFECRGYRCYQKCDSSVTPCPFGFTCVNGYCDYTCEFDSNCNNGQKCECGYCTNICTDNSQCLSGQVCQEGICREACSQPSSADTDTCPKFTDIPCTSSSDCGTNSYCNGDNCSDPCQAEKFLCATTGFTCQSGVCLKDCNKQVSCKTLPGEVSLTCGCPEPRANEFGECLLYDVLCPPNAYKPDGYILGEIFEVTDCGKLIAGSECAEDKSKCVCKQGMVQYAGAVCQQLLPGCEDDKDCSANHQCDVGHCYKKCSSTSDCSDYTDCNTESGLCQLLCNEDTDCLGHQACETLEAAKQVCVPKDTTIVKAEDPDCTTGGECEEVITEKCDDDKCRCIDGMRRSAATGKCEWLIDVVCLSCPPCLTKCSDRNMECSTESRICKCLEGYKLDESGTRCTKDDFTLTEISCDSNADCNLIPNSHCNDRFGKCQCKGSYCYKEKYCKPDWNECDGYSCDNQTTCVDLNCVDSPGTCVPDILTGTTATTNKPCSDETDCLEFGQLTYCFSGRCTCVSGSFLIDDQCKAVTLCSSVLRCPYGMSCESGICTGFRAALASTDEQVAKVKKSQVSWPAVIVSCLLVVGIIATIVVAIYTKREYELKNSTEFDDREIKDKVEFRRSSIAGKRDALQKKLSTATTTRPPSGADLTEGLGSPSENLMNENQESEKELVHGSKSSHSKNASPAKPKSLGGNSNTADEKKSGKSMNVPKHKMSAASKSSAKSKESVLTNHKAKSHAEVEERDSHKKKSTSKKSISKTRSENEHPDINPVNVTPEINIESRSKDFLAFQ